MHLKLRGQYAAMRLPICSTKIQRLFCSIGATYLWQNIHAEFSWPMGYSVYTSFRIVSLNKNVVISNPWRAGFCRARVRNLIRQATFARRLYKIFLFFKKDVYTIVGPMGGVNYLSALKSSQLRQYVLLQNRLPFYW
jgi:hypothetical protein